jgi:hypothetical protein
MCELENKPIDVERKANELCFQSKPYIQNNNLAPTCFGTSGAPYSARPKDPDEILCMLRHKC